MILLIREEDGLRFSIQIKKPRDYLTTQFFDIAEMDSTFYGRFLYCMARNRNKVRLCF
jgi:hypothetical protein